MNDNRPPQTNDLGQWLAQASLSLLLKLGLLVLGLSGLVFLAAWLLFGAGWPSVLEPETPVSASDTISSLSQPGLVEMEIDGVAAGVVQQLDPPQALLIDGFQLTVSRHYLTAAALWDTTELPANQVSWLENSIVNYVFRLPGNRGYRDILTAAATSGSVVALTTVQGNRLQFQLAADNQASPEIARQQNKPALTLIWLDEAGDNQYIVSGEYMPGTLPPQTAGLHPAIAPPPDDHLQVQLSSAEIQTNGLQLLVRGTIINRGAAAALIEAQDVELTSNGLVSQIMTVDPPLPWQIPPDNNQMLFSVTFQRPPEANAVLSIGWQRYRLSFTE